MTDISTKICTKCGSEYPATTEHFRKKKGGWLGLEARCRTCRNEEARHYPSAKSDKKKLSKSLYSKRPDVIEKRKKQKRDRYATDADFRQYILTDNNNRRNANPELTKLKKRDEYQRNKDRYRKTGRNNYLKNRDIYIERARQQKSDPIAHAIRTQRRLARKRQLPDTLTKTQWLTCLEYFNNSCAVCGKQFNADCKAYMDHWIPLSDSMCKGTVAENIVCLCGGKNGCNESKHNHDARKWLLDFYPATEAQQILDRVSKYFEEVRSHDVR